LKTGNVAIHRGIMMIKADKHNWIATTAAVVFDFWPGGGHTRFFITQVHSPKYNYSQPKNKFPSLTEPVRL
jgi:hypothetical protein